MSENKLVMKLAVSQAFTIGVLTTLLLTGSIKTHFDRERDASHPDVADNPIAEIPKEAPQQAVTDPVDGEEPNTEYSEDSQQLVDILENNMEDLLVVPDGASNEEARQLLFKEFSAAPSITQGRGNKNIYILFDPLCPHCHDLFKSFNDGLLEAHNLKAHWIPAVAFLKNPKSMEYSQKLTSSVIAGREEAAYHALKRLMLAGDFTALESNELTVTTTAILTVARNTVGLLQAATGTPTLIYENKAGGVEVVSGIPSEADLADIR